MEFNADFQTCQDSLDSIRSKHGEWKLPIPLVYTSVLVVIVFKWVFLFYLFILLNTLFNYLHICNIHNDDTWFYGTNAFTYQRLLQSRYRPTSLQTLYSRDK